MCRHRVRRRDGLRARRLQRRVEDSGSAGQPGVGREHRRGVAAREVYGPAVVVAVFPRLSIALTLKEKVSPTSVVGGADKTNWAAAPGNENAVRSAGDEPVDVSVAVMVCVPACFISTLNVRTPLVSVLSPVVSANSWIGLVDPPSRIASGDVSCLVQRLYRDTKRKPCCLRSRRAYRERVAGPVRKPQISLVSSAFDPPQRYTRYCTGTSGRIDTEYG